LSFDGRDPDQCRLVEEAAAEIMVACIETGGSITGEHGVGSDKVRYMPLVFDPETLGAMNEVRHVFDPKGLANPGKVLPVHACREWARNGRVSSRSEAVA
jgi:glycolate oxidase